MYIAAKKMMKSLSLNLIHITACKYVLSGGLAIYHEKTESFRQRPNPHYWRQWRGRKLPVPDSPGLRPTTTAYAKRCLTGWLRSLLTPNVGLLRRERRAGAGSVIALRCGATLIEMDRAVSQQLIKNLAH